MDNTQVLLPPPLTKERLDEVRARIAAIYDDLRRQGIDPAKLADPVAMLGQARDAAPVDFHDVQITRRGVRTEAPPELADCLIESGAPP